MTIENVAILFTYVVASAELSQRLSPEAADEVLREHFSILRQAIAEAGGTVSDTSQVLSEVASDERNRVIDQLLAA